MPTDKELDDAFGHYSEYLSHGENGISGGGLVADLIPKVSLSDALNPKTWTVHNLATVLMTIGVVCLIIYTFLPGTSTGWAYAAGVFAFIYVIVDSMASTSGMARDLVTTSYNDKMGGVTPGVASA